jgi:hypothetical protein
MALRSRSETCAQNLWKLWMLEAGRDFDQHRELFRRCDRKRIDKHTPRLLLGIERPFGPFFIPKHFYHGGLPPTGEAEMFHEVRTPI